MSQARIFLVEDEAIIAADLTLRLTKMNFDVVGCADNAAAALEAIARLQPDLILMDIVIKGPMNGIEAARVVRAHDDVPVVFLTSHADPKTVDGAVDSDPFGYVLKPFNDRELNVAIRVALHRQGIEAQLRRMERRMSTILASIGDGVVSTDSQGRITLLNEAAAQLTGWNSAEAVGQPLEEVLCVMDEASREPLTDLVSRGLQGQFTLGESQPLVLRQRHGNDLPMADSVAPIRDHDGSTTGVVVVFRDATERRRLEQVNRDKLAAELASQQKSLFLSRVSHELRTPLNAILGFAQLLERDRARPLDDTQRSRVERVHGAGKHLLALINDVLDLSNIEQGGRALSVGPVDADNALRASADMLEALASSKGVVVRQFELAPGLQVMADVRALEQVLINLMSNGIKYNRHGGVLEVGCIVDGDDVALWVQDQGKGLDSDQLQQLFQPFNRLGAEGTATEGSGLGLVIAKSLTEAMGGRLQVDSQVNVGSRFTVYLPRAAQPGAARVGLPTELPLAGRASNFKRGSATLLYVEDEPVNMELIAEALGEIPEWHLVLAQSGQQGIDMARALLPDLALVDINLGDMSGVDVLRELRADERTRHIRMVALSPDALPSQSEAALAAGFDAYWTKPVDLSQLVSRLQTQLIVARMRASGTDT